MSPPPPSAGNATEGDSILDLLANRQDMHILFQAVLSAGFADMFNGGRRRRGRGPLEAGPAQA